MSEFKPFDDRLNGLIAALSPAARRKLAGKIAKELRKSQQQRIKLQKAPDGSPYQARKCQPLRAKTGRIKRAMFQKLRTSRYMKASGRENSAVVEFTGKVQRIARIHQYGLKDRPNPHSQDVQYSERQLLGLCNEDNHLVEKLILRSLSSLRGAIYNGVDKKRVGKW
ncbi:phage virion morphogenesis protein [Enterobacter kobei]|uniref:phage virion morphogenesis protein n=1 Tax=Enterobacter kobei TaxID=208224 RepID=UPI002004B6AA|nr:phage virion morphogenesis protein [Enterobacter kobei]MCK7005712.1 phage virion morphogenesis protein [Enterobacter kobei]